MIHGLGTIPKPFDEHRDTGRNPLNAAHSTSQQAGRFFLSRWQSRSVVHHYEREPTAGNTPSGIVRIYVCFHSSCISPPSMSLTEKWVGLTKHDHLFHDVIEGANERRCLTNFWRQMLETIRRMFSSTLQVWHIGNSCQFSERAQVIQHGRTDVSFRVSAFV